MAAKSLVFIATCLILASTQVSGQDLQVVNGGIKITIGTTAGSIDTVHFFRDHLVETYSLYKDFLEIEFVPWGKSTVNSDGNILCTYGPDDCWANRLHRCALNMLKGDQDAQVNYMTCEFSSPLPSFVQGSYLCAQASGLNLIDVDYCVANPAVDDLDSTAQAASAGPIATIDFVPFIVFNDVPNLSLHNDALVRLKSMICFALAADENTGVSHCEL